jgi:hypothetical protein
MRVHPSATNHGVMDPGVATYTIRIKGQLGDAALSAFPRLRSRHEGAETVLIGDLDHAALYGVVSEIEALGLDLVEIRQLPPDRDTAESEDGDQPVDPASGTAQFPRPGPQAPAHKGMQP